MIENAIRTQLTTNAGVVAIAGTRCFGTYLPQNTTLPATRFWRLRTSPRELTHSGPTAIVEVFFQIDAYAETAAGAKTLAAAIVSAFNNLKGVVGGVTILRCSIENEWESLDLGEQLFSVPVEIAIVCRE